MGITRTRDVEIADAWGDDDGGVTVTVDGGRQSLSIDEAEEYGRALFAAALDARDTLRAQGIAADHQHDNDTNQPAL
jgi:hypothetical protein